MRRKKHKNTRRTVRFFRISHGFKEPFKVLLDGNFLHAYRLACQGQAPLADALAKLLGSAVKLFTSKCITRELREMGEETQESFKLARKVCKGAECSHEGSGLGAADCIADLIGGSNLEHFFVATQDVRLRRKLAEIPAVPRIFLHANGLVLEEPSASQAGIAKQEELMYQQVGPREAQILPKDSHPTEKSKFRRKKAKGPNPLAVKPKAKKKSKKPGGAGGSGDASTDKQKRSRRKKRPGADGPGKTSQAAAGEAH